MTFVEDILSQMDNVYKAQVAFLLSYFSSLFCFQGRGNLSNLHRYGGPHPRTAYRWFQRNFDYVDFNLRCLKSSGVINKQCILALDATFLKKSGKRTHGLGWFHNGCSGRTERGLELSVVAAVDMRTQPMPLMLSKSFQRLMKAVSARLSISWKRTGKASKRSLLFWLSMDGTQRLLLLRQ